MPGKKSTLPRRRFIQMLAAGGAAIAAGATPRAAAAPPPKSVKHGVPARASLPPATRVELRHQEKSVADMLQVIRAYVLPPGSDPAVAFRALRGSKRGRR